MPRKTASGLYEVYPAFFENSTDDLNAIAISF